MPSHHRKDHYSWQREQSSTSGRAFQRDNGQGTSSSTFGGKKGKTSKPPAKKLDPDNQTPASSGGKAPQLPKDSRRQPYRK